MGALSGLLAARRSRRQALEGLKLLREGAPVAGLPRGQRPRRDVRTQERPGWTPVLLQPQLDVSRAVGPPCLVTPGERRGGCRVLLGWPSWSSGPAVPATAPAPRRRRRYRGWACCARSQTFSSATGEAPADLSS